MLNKESILKKISDLIDQWEYDDINYRQSGCGSLGPSGNLVNVSIEELINELMWRLKA